MLFISLNFFNFTALIADMRHFFLSILFMFLFSFLSYSQSDFEKVIKSGEIIVNGLSFLKNNEIEEAWEILRID